MGREQMRNLEVFKIGGTQVNEFEYQKRHGEMTEQFEHRSDEAAKGSKRPTQAERVKQLIADAQRKVEKKRKREAAKAGRLKKVAASQKPAAKAGAGVSDKKRGSQTAGKKQSGKSEKSVDQAGSTRGARKPTKK